MTIITMSEGITPVRIVILKLKRTVVPITHRRLIATTSSELNTTFMDRKKRNMIKAATTILKIMNRNSSSLTFCMVTVRMYGIPE